METFNGDCLKAVLTGKITPELTIKKVKYCKNNMVCLVDEETVFLCKVLTGIDCQKKLAVNLIELQRLI